MEKGQKIEFKGKAVSPEFFNIKEVSPYLGIKKSTIYSLVEQKKIPHYRVGRLILFKKSQLDEWIEKKLVPCTSTVEAAKRRSRRRKSPHTDIDRIADKSIEGILGKRYNHPYGKPDRNQGPREGGL